MYIAIFRNLKYALNKHNVCIIRCNYKYGVEKRTDRLYCDMLGAALSLSLIYSANHNFLICIFLKILIMTKLNKNFHSYYII